MSYTESQINAKLTEVENAILEIGKYLNLMDDMKSMIESLQSERNYLEQEAIDLNERINDLLDENESLRDEIDELNEQSE